MNLAHLYYFRKLVEVRNYSRAAAELYIAQPTLSLAVSSLERELGCVLVKKKRNTLELTEEGEEFYDAVVRATNALDSATALIKERASEEYSVIRVGTVYSIQDPTWSAAIQAYHHSSRTRAQISWAQGTTESLMRDLKNGTLDVIMAGVLSPADPEVESFPAFAQGVVAVVGREHPLAQRTEISLGDLTGFPVITYRNKRGPFANEVEDLFRGHRDLQVQYEYNDEITLASLAQASSSVVAVACHSWLLSAFPNVAVLNIKNAPRDFHRFYISHLKRGRLPLAAEEFVRFMRGYDFTNVSPGGEEEEARGTDAEAAESATPAPRKTKEAACAAPRRQTPRAEGGGCAIPMNPEGQHAASQGLGHAA